MRTFQPACVTRVSDGMVINTDTEKLRAARKTTLELILSHHAVDCHHCLRIGSSSEQNLDPYFCEMCFWCDCVRDGFCELQTLAREYHVDVLPYIQHEADYEEDKSLGSVIRNPNKCMKCRRCVDVCGEVQTVHNLSMANRGRDMMVVPELGKPMAESACVRCGHCVDVCPVGAIYMEEHMDEVLLEAHSYHVETIVQLSDNVIPELARLYKVDESELTGEKICAALHRNGFKKVISDEYAKAVAAAQAAKLIDENIGKGTVILTNSNSVKNFIDQFFADMKDKVLTYDSTQTVFAQLAKELADKKPVTTVHINSIKEFGAEAKERSNVDYVLNARELYRLFIRSGGAPAKRPPEAFDRTWDDAEVAYEELLADRKWNLSREIEESDGEAGAGLNAGKNKNVQIQAKILSTQEGYADKLSHNGGLRNQTAVYLSTLLTYTPMGYTMKIPYRGIGKREETSCLIKKYADAVKKRQPVQRKNGRN